MKPYEQRFPWDLDWNLLRTFKVVVEQGGITKAANFLGLTQPTLSSALKRLELAIGEKLIDRRPGHFQVTNAGRVLFKECSSLFGSVSQIPGTLQQTKDSIGGHISISMTSHIVSAHFDDVLRLFNQAHPDVTYSMSVSESSEVIDRVRENRATFGLCLMQERDKELVSTPLYQQFFGLFCGPSHRLFGKLDIDHRELRGEPSVAFQTEVESGPLFLVAELRERALLNPKMKGVSANLLELRRMIVTGIGIGALPLHIARRDIEAGLLWQLPPYANLPNANLYLVTNPRRSCNPAESRLLQALDTMMSSTDLSDRTYR